MLVHSIQAVDVAMDSVFVILAIGIEARLMEVEHISTPDAGFQVLIELRARRPLGDVEFLGFGRSISAASAQQYKPDG